jgi:hypothetical protein
VHPWFRGVQWEKLYQMKAAFIPEVNGELDTQNFEKFEEVKIYFPLLVYFCKLSASIIFAYSIRLGGGYATWQLLVNIE